MGADIYLDSEYERRAKEYRLDEKRAALDAARQSASPDSDEANRLLVEYEETLNKVEDGTYYRDSYNASNLAWLVGLSYWGEGESLNKDGNLPPERAAHWLNVLQQADIKTIVIDAIENNKKNAGKKPLDNDRLKPELELDANEKVEDVVEYFERKRQRFMALLTKSIELNEPLSWSV